MKVFLGELFGRVAGGVDDAHRPMIPAREDRDGQGARPAGGGTSLREAVRACHNEGGLEGGEQKPHGASLGSGERA